jgi:WD40 repeat protein
VVPYTEGNVITYDTRSWNIEKIYTVSAERVTGKSPNQVHLIIDENKDIFWVSHSGLVREVRLSDGSELSNFQTFEMTIARMELNARSGEIVVGGTSMVSEARQPNGEFKIYRDDPATLVRAYDPQSGRQTRTYLGAGGSVMGLSIIADDSLIAASKSRIMGTSPSYVLLWDAKTGSLLASKEYGQSRVGDVAFSPDGSALAYVVDNVVHLVKLENPTIADGKK